METNTETKQRKQHKKPIYTYARQTRWLLWRFVSEQTCCFCGEILFDEHFDLKHCNTITIHHLKGDRYEDDYSKPAKVKRSLFAHSACHKSYHSLCRAKRKRRKYNKELLTAYNENIRRMKENV